MSAEPESRNDWGLPLNIEAHEKANQTTHVDQSVNKALPWFAFSWLLSGLALGLVIAVIAIAPAYIDAKVKAGTAPAEEVARSARTDARVALDKVEQTQVQLGAKGLVQPSTH